MAATLVEAVVIVLFSLGCGTKKLVRLGMLRVSTYGRIPIRLSQLRVPVFLIRMHNREHRR